MVLLVRDLNSITFEKYKNEFRIVPETDAMVPEL